MRLFIVSLITLGVLLSQALPMVGAQTATPTATPGAIGRPDACERNERREDACNIPIDLVNGPYTFLPAGDQDWYRADLGQPNGLQTTITTRYAGGLDLIVSISRDDGTPLTAYSSPSISTTLAAEVSGPIIIRIENRAAGDPSGGSYNIELRKTLPLAPTPPTGLAPTLTPDIGENNWSVDTATPIAVGVVYDMNFTCPVLGGCGGGDHDYVAVPVKQGGKYLIATFDLAPGVDTALDLFWGNPNTPLTTSDDYGIGMLSVLRWVAPSNGTVIIRVGPRNGGMNQIVADKQSGFYRFAVALAGTELEKQLSERINQQGAIPTPTPRPAAPGGSGVSSPPAGGNSAVAPPAQPAGQPSVSNDAPKGEAVVVAESTVLREGPAGNAPAIMTLPQETLVVLLGQASGAFVRVQPQGGVIPGWVRGADLHLLGSPSGNQSGSATALPGVNISPTPASTTTVRPASGGQSEPLPMATPISFVAPQRASVNVTVQLYQSTNQTMEEDDPADTFKPISGARVQLVNAFGDILTEAVTPANGQVTLTRDVDAGSAVYVRVPAMGIQIQVATTTGTANITIKIPGGSR